MDFLKILHDVYCNSLDGIVIADKDSIITDVNPAYETLTGYSRAELVGQRTSIVRSGLTPPEVFREMWAQIDAQARWVGELINRRKDGELWYSYLSITKVVGENGEIAYVGIARDVTSRKEMEQQLRQHLLEIQLAREEADLTASRLQAMLESVGEAIIMVDTQGRCVAANHLSGGVLGVPAERLIDSTIQDLAMHTQQVFRKGGAMEWPLAPGELPLDEVRSAVLETHDEPPRVYYEFSAPVQNEVEKVIGRIYVYRDITKETEVDRMKSEFIATVSHELRTPMTSIKGALGLVLGGIAGALPANVCELLTIAQNNADRLIRLINDILDISRIEAGKVEIKPVPLSVAEALKRAVQEMEGFAVQRSIQMVVRAPEEMPRVVADADRLQQVLVNLISNAIKFSDPHTQVVITAAQESNQIKFQVEDQGPGIPPEHLTRIFDKFQRIDHVATRRAGGTGLGLAICKAIVSEHGGQIWVESEVGVGSTFCFTLPVEITVGSRELIDKTVLVVDDDPNIVGLVMLALEHAGIRAVGATSGEQALQIARNQPIDIITLDLLMPGMHGLEVARHLKEDASTREIPVVVVSAFTNGQETDLVAMGIAGVIPKPIKEERLLSVIRDVLGRRDERLDEAPSILIVDDDPGIRRIVSLVLERAGYATRTAADGQEGFRMIMEKRPDLLILDLMMPNLDGFQLVRLLRQRRWTRQIPLLVLTALDLTEREVSLLQLGPTHHLSKGPMVNQEIIERVRELLLETDH